MNYLNEHIIKTFEYLFYLRGNILTRKSRPLYRINQEKLDKYRSQYNGNQHLELNENKILSEKVIDRSTQTTYNKRLDLSTDSNLSINPKAENDDDIESSNTLSSSEINESKRDSNSTSLSSFSSQTSNSPKRVYIRSIVQHMLGDSTSNN